MPPLNKDDQFELDNTNNPNLLFLFHKIGIIEGAMQILKENTEKGHPCKWNGEIGRLVQFNIDTPDIRSNIFKRLDKNDEDIDKLSNVLTKLTAQDEVLDRIEEKQEKNITYAHHNRTYIKWTLIAVVVAGTIGFCFNIILELFKHLIY